MKYIRWKISPFNSFLLKKQPLKTGCPTLRPVSVLIDPVIRGGQYRDGDLSGHHQLLFKIAIRIARQLIIADRGGQNRDKWDFFIKQKFFRNLLENDCIAIQNVL